MKDWNEDNFLEKLMPRRPGRQGGVQDSCPDEESLCAYAEDRVSGDIRDGIAAHLKACASCSNLYQRLMEFARPRTPVPEDEWTQAEKRLGIWMDGFLRAESRRERVEPLAEAAIGLIPGYWLSAWRNRKVFPAVAKQPDAARNATRGGWFSAWKIQWVFAAVGTLVVSGATYFFMFGPGGGYLQTAMHSPLSTGPIDVQIQQRAAPQSKTSPDSVTSATQAAPTQPAAPGAPNQNAPAAQSTQTYAYRYNPGPPRQHSTQQIQPVPPASPNQNAPVAPSTATPTYTAQNPAAPEPRLDGGNQSGGRNWGGFGVSGIGHKSSNAIATEGLTPEVKASITEEVKAQISAEQVAATTNSTGAAPTGEQIPGAIDPKQRMFIVSTGLAEQTSDRAQCSLSAGDVLTRVSDTLDANLRVTAMVTSSQRNDCATGSMLAISVWELQDMHNDFTQKIDAGLQKLADSQGKNGMPVGPLAGRRVNQDGQAQPDITASGDLQQQLQDADNAEKDVNQAAAGITPSAFHPSPRRPANFEIFSRFGDDSLRISQGTKPESGALTLIAWRPDSQQSNAHPQQAAPAKPAPAPKAPPPAASPKPAPTQPSRPPAPAKNAPAPVQRPASPTQQKPAAHLPALGGRASAPRANSSPMPALGPDKMGLPGGGSREMRANGSSVYRDRSGRVTSVTTRTGVMATFDPKGHVSSINFRSTKGYGITVNHGAHGTRTVVSERVNDRGERIKVVNTGSRRGYVDRTFFRNNRPFMTRTYVVNGRSYATVYHGFYHGGRVYYGYVPGYFYAPAFYGWAYAPWGVPVTFAWGWGGAPWYGYYGYYFAPYPAYAGPAFWLTDYVIAESLQAAYEAQADGSSSAIPRQFVPRLGAKSENEFTAVMIPAISDALKSDPVPKQCLA